jgi:hypothetical protein
LRQAFKDLLRAADAISPARDRPEAIIDRDGRVAKPLNLLQHGIGAPAREDVTRQEQQRKAVACATAAAVTMFVARGPMELVQAIMRRRRLALAKAIAAKPIACSLCARKVGSRSHASYNASPIPATLPCPKMAKTPTNKGTSRPSTSLV